MTSVASALGELKQAVANSVAGRLTNLATEMRLRRQYTPPTDRDQGRPCIALVSGTACKTPPLGYGGVERRFHAQALDLARRGWDVHLWGDFHDPATGLYEGLTLHPGWDLNGYEALEIGPDIVYRAYLDEQQIRRYQRLNDCVIVGEFNSPQTLPPLNRRIKVRCMSELFRDLAIRQGFAPEQVITCLPYQGEGASYQPEVPREDWLLWVGRADPCKALEEAFRFSQLTDLPVKVACRQPDLVGNAYQWALWRLMPEKVSYIGEIDVKTKRDLYSRCRALFYTAHPSWQEAFGLIFLDALASGTPVLALDHHAGSTQSAFFPGPPYGLRAVSTEELAQQFRLYGDELHPEAVAKRYREIYGDGKVEAAFADTLSSLR